MAAFKGDDRAADGIPVEVRLDNGGYFEAFLMDIINGEALIHFPCNWIEEGMYPFFHVRFPPAVNTTRCDLQEKMIAEVLVNKNKGFYEGWFKCCIQMLKSEFCQFEYLDTQNSSDFGYTCNMRKLNMNPHISMDMLYVHEIFIPEDIREYAKCEDVHRPLKDAIISALVNYHADRGVLVIISRNIADISRAQMLEKAHLRSLSQKTRVLQLTGKLNRKLEIAKSGGFTAEFTVPETYLGMAIGKEKVQLRAAKNIKGISFVQLLRQSNKFVVHGETEEAVKEARELLEIKIEPYPVQEEHMSQLVGRESANIHKIVQATGAVEIYVEHIKDAIEKKKMQTNLPLYIIGTSQAIKKAKLFVQFQIDHIHEVQRLRARKLEINREIADFLRTGTTPDTSDLLSVQTNATDHDSEAVQSTHQTLSSTNLSNYNMDELEELENLNELLLEDYEGPIDLDIILETSGNLEATLTGDINLEDTIIGDVTLGDTNEEDDLGDNTTRLNVSMESDHDNSRIPDATNLDNQSRLFYGMENRAGGYYIPEKPKEVEEVVIPVFQYVEDPDFWTTDNVDIKTTDIDNTPADPLLNAQDTVEKVESVGFEFVEDPDFWTSESVDLEIGASHSLSEAQDTTCNLITEQVDEEICGVISEAVTYTKQVPKNITYELPRIHSIATGTSDDHIQSRSIATQMQQDVSIYFATRNVATQSYIEDETVESICISDEISGIVEIDTTGTSSPTFIEIDSTSVSTETSGIVESEENDTIETVCPTLIEVESRHISKNTSIISKSGRNGRIETSSPTFSEIESRSVSTDTSEITECGGNDTIETLCPTLIAVESRYISKGTSGIKKSDGHRKIATALPKLKKLESKPAASSEIGHAVIATKKRIAISRRIPVKTKKLKNVSTKTITKSVEEKATETKPSKGAEIQNKTSSSSKIGVATITTKQPIATPRLSLLKKSTKLISVSTETEGNNINETALPVIIETENKKSVSTEIDQALIEPKKHVAIPRRIPIKRPVLKSQENTKTVGRNTTATSTPIVRDKENKIPASSKISHLPIAAKNVATQIPIKSKKFKVVPSETRDIPKSVKSNAARTLPYSVVGKENKDPASSKIAIKKRIAAISHIAVKCKKLKPVSTGGRIIKSMEKNTIDTSPSKIVEIDDNTADSSEMCHVLPDLIKEQDDAEYLVSLVKTTKKPSSEAKVEDNMECSLTDPEQNTSRTTKDVKILTVCTIVNNAEEEPDMKACETFNPDDESTSSEIIINISDLEDSDLNPEKSASSKSDTSSYGSDISIKTGTTVICGNLEDVHEISCQTESQCDDQDICPLPMDDVPLDLDCTDVSEDLGFEEEVSTTPLANDKSKNSSFIYLFKRIGYEGPLLNEKAWKAAINEGLTNLDYNDLVVYLSEELHSLRKIHKHINSMATSSHWDIFSEELVEFMREIKCPYRDLVSTDASGRFRKTKQRKLLIKFLISEILCNRLLHNLSQLKKLEASVTQNYQVSNRDTISALLCLPVFPTDATIRALEEEFNRSGDSESSPEDMKRHHSDD